LIGVILFFRGGVARFNPFFAKDAAALLGSLSQLLTHNLSPLYALKKQVFLTKAPCEVNCFR